MKCSAPEHPPHRRAVLAMGGAAALAPAAAIGAPTNTISDAESSQACFEQFLHLAPELATSLGLDKGADGDLKARLNDRSTAGRDEQAQWCARWLARFRDPRATNSAGPTDLAIVRYGLELGREGAAFRFGDSTFNAAMSEGVTPYIVNPMMGDWQAIPDFMETQHRLAEASDAEAYLARLREFARALDQESVRIREDADGGVTLPETPWRTASKAVQSVRDHATGDSSLVTSFRTRLAAAGIHDRFSRNAAELILSEVAPALNRQCEALAALTPTSDDTPGAWRLPEGEAYYAWALRVGTSTALGPSEVHDVGVAQCRSIAAKMEAQLTRIGLTQGSVADRMGVLARDPKTLYPDTDAGRAEILAEVARTIAGIRPKLPAAFSRLPRCPVDIRRVPAAAEAGGPAGYLNPAPLDQSRPSTFYINLRSTSEWPRWIIPTLAYHETIPGHAWQAAYLAASRPLPPLRALFQFNAYLEGWAVYAEQLCEELGAYEGNDLGLLGHWQNQLFRAARLVADTGLHSQRWTREQAVRFMIETTGRPRAGVYAEVDRYIVAPGQGCGYKIGHNEFLRLRADTQRRLGAGFSLAAFHDVVLGSGPAPFEVLQGALLNARPR